MVRKQVYKRSLYWKPACQRHLFQQIVVDAQGVPLIRTVCVRDEASFTSAESWRCSFCEGALGKAIARESMCALPTKATRESLVSSSGSSVAKSTMFDSFPELWDFLTCPKLPDGNKRQTGRLSLCCEHGMWKLALNDEHTSLYACLTSQDLDNLILMAEARMAEATMPWKPSQYGGSGRKKLS